MSKSRDAIYICLLFLVVLFLWTAISRIPGPAYGTLPDIDGAYGLSEAELEHTVYMSLNWESWPEKLYRPEELPFAGAPSTGGFDTFRTQYATHRLLVSLPPGETYGMSMKTSDFAMRLFINGEEADLVGLPGETRETSVPRTQERVYYFTPQGEITEIVAQVSNFVHREGCWPPEFYIGTAQNIALNERNNNIKAGLVIGSLITACLYYLSAFLMNRRQTSSLIFAACCLLLILLTNKLIPLFFPEYNWHIALKVEYAVHFLTFAAVVTLIKTLFPKLLHELPFRLYLIFCGAFLAVTLATDSAFYTSLLIYFDAVSGLAAAYILVRFGMGLREKDPRKILAFAGTSALCLFSLNDVLSHNNITMFGPIAGQFFTAPLGMVLFAFFYALAVSLDQAETVRRLEAAERVIAETEARYIELAKKKEIEKTPNVRLSDFGLTKRESDVAWLLLDGKSRAEIAEALSISLGTVNTHCTRVYQKTSSRNMAGLARLILSGAPPEDKNDAAE